MYVESNTTLTGTLRTYSVLMPRRFKHVSYEEGSSGHLHAETESSYCQTKPDRTRADEPRGGLASESTTASVNHLNVDSKQKNQRMRRAFEPA